MFAFEPSPRERRALRLHASLNLCSWNVNVQKLALGNEETEADLHVVQGGETGCKAQTTRCDKQDDPGPRTCHTFR